MNAITQRTFSRNRYVAPILYTDCNSKGKLRKAVMHNSSVGGMYFESKKSILPGTGLFIKLAEFVPDPYWPEAQESYLGEARWCIEKQKDDCPVFGVGVRFVRSTCEQCGAKIYRCGCLDLCPDCQDDISSISDVKLKGCLENYLMGNVL